MPVSSLNPNRCTPPTNTHELVETTPTVGADMLRVHRHTEKRTQEVTEDTHRCVPMRITT